MSALALEPDPFDARRARRAAGLLAPFNDAAVLAGADVHVATRLAELAGETDESVILAAALAVRSPRLGHVHVDLARIRETAVVEADQPVDLGGLPWPQVEPWVERVAASDLVAVGDEDEAARPLRLVDSWLYLDRYWGEERRLAADLRALARARPGGVRSAELADGLERLFADETDSRQCLAAAAAVLRRLAVVAGGPGTGKTTTVARIVALIAEQSEPNGSPPLVALAAPTGKAAARLQEAVREDAQKLAVSDSVRTLLLELEASTLHRLLGWRPGSFSRYRHDRRQRLPHDLVVIDETSMVSLSMMARLVEALRDGARLVLVGDPGQLASIEAGAVLGDLVGPAIDSLAISPDARAELEQVTGQTIAAAAPPAGVRVGDGIVVLDRVHRFGGGIAELATAIRRGDVEAAIELLADPPEDVIWIPVEAGDPGTAGAIGPVRERATSAGRAVIEAARAGEPRRALAALGSFRVLCAHRRGPQGVGAWTARIEDWLAADVDELTTEDHWYVGRPLLVTENDYELRLYNGDTGVIVDGPDDRPRAAFERGGEVIEYASARSTRSTR